MPLLSFGQLIPPDKQKHFIAGSVVSIPSMVTDRAIVHAILFSTAAGVSKELYDQRVGGYFNRGDIVFTIAGGITTALIIDQIKKRKRRLNKFNP
jgi:hypothetical protein